jgi:L-serine dehydratase
MGPERAARWMQKQYPDAERFEVVLYGSLASTGKGHNTDLILTQTFAPTPCKVLFDTQTPCPVHPNTMDITAFTPSGKITRRVYSVGGGTITIEGEPKKQADEVYHLNTYADIADYCRSKNMRIPDYVRECEGDDIFEYLHEMWGVMKNSIQEGLTASGVLPGILQTPRKAQYLYSRRHIDESSQTRENRLVCAYAFAVSEQNAAGGVIVTAPTCGSCGVLPSVLKYYQETRGFSDEKIELALATGGIIGNLIKQNASISGAECGCQAECGSACSMAAAALAELFEMGLDQIDYAAEVAMEHHLGLTCDPIAGLVQIPCIERNAVAAMRAINALSLANFLTGSRKISFDVVVQTMYNTGKDLLGSYRETSSGGLAKYYPLSKQKD